MGTGWGQAARGPVDSTGDAALAPLLTCDDVVRRLWTEMTCRGAPAARAVGGARRAAQPPSSSARAPVPSWSVRGPAQAGPTPGPEGSGEDVRVEVRRSDRRRRTVSAYREGDTVVVMLPARMTRAEEQRWVAEMLERVTAREQRRRPSDDALLVRAEELARRHLGGKALPRSVRWVDNQGSRWGSCTPADASIRLSRRLQGMPPWVVDYVLVHELAHLLVPGHGPDFWALVAAYPKADRARGYLEGVAATAGLDVSDE